jgi:primase-polymerase (primpol)-like protein
MNANANFLIPKIKHIPDSLKQLPWGVWKAEPREGTSDKFNKAPRCPLSGRKIGANHPEKFGTFHEAKAAYETGQYTGVGVVLNGSGIVGVDIDDYADVFSLRPEVKAWLCQAIKQGVYCEKSPSGKGLRLFMIGKLPTSGRKSAGLEIYDDARFLTVTGHVVRPRGVA